jgi:hypothetical protein
VDEIEGLSPCPLAENIINLEDAVGRHPCDRWREHVHATDGSCGIEVGNITDLLVRASFFLRKIAGIRRIHTLPSCPGQFQCLECSAFIISTIFKAWAC